jgi:2-polyprenyl-3-methyl-5-hydroxy-6-metoxy-1,4-benzoquinol methylase
MSDGRTCPACGGERFRRRDVLAGLTTHACVGCGLLLSTIARTGGTVSEFALVDEASYLRSVGGVRRRQAVRILSLLQPHVAAGARVLDVGCSFGFFLLEARLAGFDVHGIEPDPQAYEAARAALGEGVVQPGLLDAETASPGSADVLCTLDVIEHIPPEEHAGFASRVAETLAPDGIWVIKVPTTEGLYYRVSDILARAGAGASLVTRLWQTRYEFPHLVYFDRSNLTRWLERYGFEVVDHAYLQEVENATVIDRLTHDRDISTLRAYLLAPGIVGVNVVEALRRRSDSLVVLARAVER